jgi:ssDNA-binding Zn-finger/Zn-ribbon topoisomerase 1
MRNFVGYGSLVFRCSPCGIEGEVYLGDGKEGPAPDLAGCATCASFRNSKHGRFRKDRAIPKCRRCRSPLHLVFPSIDEPGQSNSVQACPRCGRPLVRRWIRMIWD